MKYNCKLGLSTRLEKTHLIEQLVGFYTGTTEFTIPTRFALALQSLENIDIERKDEQGRLNADRQKYKSVYRMERSPNFSLYPAGIHLPLDTSEAVFSSISGWAVATSSCEELVYSRHKSHAKRREWRDVRR